MYHSCPPSKPVEGSGLRGKSGEAVLFSWFRRLKDGIIIIICWLVDIVLPRQNYYYCAFFEDNNLPLVETFSPFYP